MGTDAIGGCGAADWPDRTVIEKGRVVETAKINVACSLGLLTQAHVDELAAMSVHRYHHNTG